MGLKMGKPLRLTAIIALMFATILAVQGERHNRCGLLNPRYYNTKTHDCKNGIVGRITAKSTIHHDLCGKDFPRYYNPQTYVCENGSILKITTKPTERPHVKTVRPTTPSAPPKNVPAPKTPPDILDCTLSQHIGKSKGLRCCGGFYAYDPRFATCCQGGNLKTAVVHRNKEEKMHACCNSNPNVLYTRGSRKMPCKHPSLNDKLFRGQHRIQVIKQKCSDYMDYQFAYTIQIHYNTTLHSKEHYVATITQMAWKSKLESLKSFQKFIPIDKYSPKVRHIHKKYFVVLSNYDQSQEHVLDFYLDRTRESIDVIFVGTGPTTKTVKRLKKLRKKCRRKQSGRKQPRRKQSRRKQSGRKQSAKYL